MTQLLYQNRRNMLDQVVGEILIENAAAGTRRRVSTSRRTPSSASSR